VRQAVQVRTNAPDKERVTLMLTANVIVDVEALQPNILRFDSRQDRPQVTIKNFTDTPIEVLRLVPPNSYLMLTASDAVIPPHGEIIVTADVAADTPDGVISDWAELHTNLISQPVVYVRVWANLQSES
jgi:hypothetical protein